MAEQQKSPFDRVSNGYDPRQVAAFAAEALTWKREHATLRSELNAARKVVERYESVIGSIEAVEREAAEIVGDADHRAAEIIENAERLAAEIIERAENEAAQILEMAQDMVSGQTEPAAELASETPEVDADRWLAPEHEPSQTPDEVDSIFEPAEGAELADHDAERERRVAAAAANLWKRRGVLAPPE